PTTPLHRLIVRPCQPQELPVPPHANDTTSPPAPNQPKPNNVLSVPSNSKPSSAPKVWEKVHQLQETVWETEILDWSWVQFQKGLLFFLKKDQTHLGVHMAKLHGARILKWKCIILGHCVYGNKVNHMVTQDSEFTPFLEAVKQSPTSKITIKITMTDPSKSAKSMVQPNLDVNSLVAIKIVADITAHILDVYGGTTESMRVKDPRDPDRSIYVNHQNLWVWAQAILHGAEGVNLLTLPDSTHFQSDNVKIFTLNEHLARLANSARLSLPTSDTSIQLSPDQQSKTGCVMAPQSIPPLAGRNEACATPPAHPVSHLEPAFKHSWATSTSSNMELLGPSTWKTNCQYQVQDQHSSTRKFPTSGGSSYARSSTHSPSIIMDSVPRPGHTQDFRPLTAAGRAMSMNEFLDFCNFARDDMIPCGLIDLAHIWHWSYFQEGSLLELQDL
ncbi:hypothetical protein VP01_3802g2, partial [Puccinia sorghi]